MAIEASAPFTPALLRGTIAAEVREIGGIAPLSLIRTDQDVEVHVRWTVEGELTEFVSGSWRVSVRLESIGPGPERRLPEPALAVVLAPAPGPNVYTAVVRIPAGTIDVGGDATPFTLITVVTYRTPLGQPGPIAGMVEGPTVLIYAR